MVFSSLSVCVCVQVGGWVGEEVQFIRIKKLKWLRSYLLNTCLKTCLAISF